MNRTNHYWSVGAGALLLVAASCGGTEATTTSATPSTTVATTTTTAPATTAAAASPEQIATSFIEAKGSWDADAAEALLAADASVSDLEVPRHADYAAQYRLYRAVEWQWTVDECNETEAGRRQR